jgi:hypothetical protein
MSRFKHQMGMARLRVRGMAKVSYAAVSRQIVVHVTWKQVKQRLQKQFFQSLLQR